MQWLCIATVSSRWEKWKSPFWENPRMWYSIKMCTSCNKAFSTVERLTAVRSISTRNRFIVINQVAASTVLLLKENLALYRIPCRNSSSHCLTPRDPASPDILPFGGIFLFCSIIHRGSTDLAFQVECSSPFPIVIHNELPVRVGEWISFLARHYIIPAWEEGLKN